jgi:hypothetical protein
MSAAAFVAAGATPEAEQLLDQLAALQHTDGSIEIAFNVATDEAESVFRAGTIAAVGLAGTLYDQRTRSTRYLAMEQRAAGYLLSLQGSNGLLRGGPDVSWYSTQHNLLAYAFLVLLGNELTGQGNRTAAATDWSAAARVASGLETNLLVRKGSTAYFTEGLGDNVQALDADALGIMYLESRGETSLAQQVLTYTQSAFAVSGRSVALSNKPGDLQHDLQRPGSVLRVCAVPGVGRARCALDRGVGGDAGRGEQPGAVDDRAGSIAGGHRRAHARKRARAIRPDGDQRAVRRRIPRVAQRRDRRVDAPGHVPIGAPAVPDGRLTDISSAPCRSTSFRRHRWGRPPSPEPGSGVRGGPPAAARTLAG